MSNTPDIRTATCLCGAVTFTATLKTAGIQLCHCQQCQRWTGGGPLTVLRVEDVQTQGQDSIQSYHASAHGERAFCKTCGTTLYWKMQGRDIAFLPVGLFHDQTGLSVRDEIFVDHRPDWLPAFEGATQQKEAELQAQLTAFLERDAT
ncbi:MAG: GFA family protein [Paracoccaceae bacterium]